LTVAAILSVPTFCKEKDWDTVSYIIANTQCKKPRERLRSIGFGHDSAVKYCGTASVDVMLKSGYLNGWRIDFRGEKFVAATLRNLYNFNAVGIVRIKQFSYKPMAVLLTDSGEAVLADPRYLIGDCGDCVVSYP
jgi:hypothetical protein